jgi:type I restriction enzyme S subunit
MDYVDKRATGGTIKHLNQNILVNFPVIISPKNEQVKIGVFFSKLDDAITLHQRKLDKLKNIKKSLLEKIFPKEDACVPEIRFAGFTDEWEQRKLGEVSTFSKGFGYSKNDLQENGTQIILYGRMYTSYETEIREVDTLVNPKEGSVYSKGNEVILPASGETAEDISRASAIVKPGIILGGDLNIVCPNDFLSSTFLALTLSSGNQQKEISKKAQGKTVVHIHNSDLKDVNIKYPSLSEQQKIGSFFHNLDNLITLHQRKLDKLKNIKKSCLEALFV